MSKIKRTLWVLAAAALLVASPPAAAQEGCRTSILKADHGIRVQVQCIWMIQGGAQLSVLCPNGYNGLGEPGCSPMFNCNDTLQFALLASGTSQVSGGGCEFKPENPDALVRIQTEVVCVKNAGAADIAAAESPEEARYALFDIGNDGNMVVADLKGLTDGEVSAIAAEFAHTRPETDTDTGGPRDRR